MRDDGRPFDAGNLEVSWMLNGRPRCWRPGDIDTGNLGSIPLSHDALQRDFMPTRFRPYDPMKGFDCYGHPCGWPQGELALMIARELGYDERVPEAWEDTRRLWRDEPPKHLHRWPKAILEARERLATIPPGLLTRSGLSIIRDDTVAWNPNEDWPEPTRADGTQVLHLFAYGHDYKMGLGLMRSVFGAAPPIPDWALGVWFSCYRRMGEEQFRIEKRLFDRHQLPLDVVVVDTDWHRFFWHGFDWNTRLFPDPDRFGAWLREEGLHAAFNVHPLTIPAGDSRLPRFLRESGARHHIMTKEESDRFRAGCQAVDLFDKRQGEAWFRIFHPPIERQGCDLWWVDGMVSSPMTGQDCTAVLNELTWRETHVGRRERPPVLSRASGLGAHRSTILFTGDTHSQWDVLREQVRSTQRAANKLWAYVSHDIGGFFRDPENRGANRPPTDLFVRWAQFGALSPILRFHSDHGIREPWRFGRQALDIVRRFLRLRKCLLPCLRDLAREAQETGVAMVRPMYYEFPECEQAYAVPLQYMFGPALLVSPVTTEDARVATWIPPGRWHHAFLPRVIEGPARIEEMVPLGIMPLYVREGTPVLYLPHQAVGNRRARPRTFDAAEGETLLGVMGLD
jgi:alpha-glucosidase (family GH31 glycosyl hydrolase)